MSVDQRDVFWDVSFETYYDAYYHELLAEALISRWQMADDITKVAVALTTSGSAVAGWALWSQAGWRGLWVAVAGVAAIAAIVHAALAVPSRLKAWCDTRTYFSGLRLDLETLRQQMQVHPLFALDEYAELHAGLRNRLKGGIQELPDDVLQRRRLELRVQDDLNERLANVIVHD